METLRALREARGWTRAELARRAQMHPSSISGIEGGRLRPYPSQLSKLARALGVEASELDPEQPAAAVVSKQRRAAGAARTAAKRARRGAPSTPPAA